MNLNKCIIVGFYSITKVQHLILIYSFTKIKIYYGSKVSLNASLLWSRNNLNIKMVCLTAFVFVSSGGGGVKRQD